MATVDFTEDAVKAHLDKCIRHWRLERNTVLASEKLKEMAAHYIDAYQSVRMSLFGSLLGC